MMGLGLMVKLSQSTRAKEKFFSPARGNEHTSKNKEAPDQRFFVHDN
jgi:hypothetical protein